MPSWQQEECLLNEPYSRSAHGPAGPQGVQDRMQQCINHHVAADTDFPRAGARRQPLAPSTAATQQPRNLSVKCSVTCFSNWYCHSSRSSRSCMPS